MQIDHIAIWTNDLEALRSFYVTYFEAQSSPKYRNESKGFESYFLSFANGARIEIMSSQALEPAPDSPKHVGLAHFAFQAGSREAVISFTQKLREAGFQAISEARITGDGYFESCVLDPNGNQVEIVAR
jgi:lactoylglutathione lyase